MKDNHKHGTPVQPLTEHLSTQSHQAETSTVSSPMVTEKKRDMSALYVPMSIIVAAIIISFGLYFGLAGKGGAATGGAAQGQQPSANTNIKDVDISGRPFIGKGNAPVVMAYWYDYQCPFCKAVDTGGIPQIPTPAAMPDIIKNYVNTGKVKVVFFDYPFLGQDSIDGALYSHAVWDLYPQQWFNWHQEMFHQQDEEGDQGFGDAASIEAMIKSKFPQMDVAKIKAYIASNKDAFTKELQDERAVGAAQGVNGTPGFVIGTTLISGADQYSAFEAAIEAVLNK